MKNQNKNQNNIEIEIDAKAPNVSEQKKEYKLENNINSNIFENNNLNKEIKEDEKFKLFLITKYSSLKPDLFSNEIISDFKCISCGLIPSFEIANETLCCGNLICQNCLKKLNEDKKGCSICNKEELKTREIKKENNIFCKTFKNFIIKCPYKCEWKGPWDDLESHLNECKLGYKECKYKSIGCGYINENIKVIEHEKFNDKYHLNLAMKFIKDKNIVKKKIKFELGETCMTICHPHKMTYMKYISWICDGSFLENGCYSYKKKFGSEVARFRCDECDFDLCDKCIVHYAI